MTTSRLFQLIDLDRTLFDTARFITLLTDEINLIHPGLGTVLADKAAESYRNGVTFFLLRYLRDQLGDAEFEALVEKIVEREGVDSLLLPGVKERLLFADTLTDARPAWGVITYGDDIDQRMKLRLIGLQHVPTLVTPSSDKGAVLSAWKNEDGSFTLPEEFGGITVEILTLEDDKLGAFLNAPEGVVGICINPTAPTEKHVSNAGYRIHVVKDLFDSMHLLSTELQ